MKACHGWVPFHKNTLEVGTLGLYCELLQLVSCCTLMSSVTLCDIPVDTILKSVPHEYPMCICLGLRNV